MKEENKNLVIDSHAHLNFKSFDLDLEKIINKNLKNNVWVINAGSNYKTSQRAVEIANNYEKGIYSSIGLHPIHVVREFTKTDDEDGKDFENKFDYEKYKKLALSSNKVVAIGETGLDYYYKPKSKLKLNKFKAKQKDVFINHLNLAKELNLPLIFHCRMAHQELIEILKSQNLFFTKKQTKLKGVIHCFTGNWQEAQEYLDMGFYLGFTGIIFKLNLESIIKKIPLDKILIETDCPYLTPPKAMDISKRNEPLFVKYVAEEIARVKNISLDKIIKKTTQNAINLFNL